MASKVNKWEQKIAAANPEPDYKVGQEKKTWKNNGHSGGGHTAHGTTTPPSVCAAPISRPL
jgi:hypothetical protein